MVRIEGIGKEPGRPVEVPCPGDGYVVLQDRLLLTALPDTAGPHQGWLEIAVAKRRYCFQREMNSAWYLLRYRKTLGAVTPCVSNTDRDLSAWLLTPECRADSFITVDPADPKLSNVVWDLELRAVIRE